MSLLLDFSFCRFFQNRASYGGALYLEDAQLRIFNSSFAQNEADLSGGAIYVNNIQRSTLSIFQSSFEMNVAHGDSRMHGLDESALLRTSNRTLMFTGMGGALFAHDPVSVEITSSTFLRNRGCRGAGGLGVTHFSLAVVPTSIPLFNISHSVFEENQGFCGPQPDALLTFYLERYPNPAGGVMYESSTEADIVWTLSHSNFTRNSAVYGGGLSIQTATSAMIDHRIASCRFTGNKALSGGGGLFMTSGMVSVMSSNFTQGRATYGAGVTAIEWATLSVIRNPTSPEEVSYIEGNVAIYAGGIYTAAEGVPSDFEFGLERGIGF